MNFAVALLYWIIVTLWLVVLMIVCVAYLRNPRIFGTARLLLAVLIIDALRNVTENFYFGVYFGGKYGLFPAGTVGVLGRPEYVIIPKLMNVVAGCAVLGLLILRWLPMALRERTAVEAEVRQTTEALRLESEERRRLFETSLDMIVVTDRQGTFTQVSPSSLSILGYLPEDMLGRSGTEFIFPKDLESVRHQMRQARSGHHIRNFEARHIHQDGHIVPMIWSGVWFEPEKRHFFFGRDVTERKVAEEKLKYLAHYDQLTGLPNRISLLNDLEKLQQHSVSASSRATSIAVLDLDSFGGVNDTLGYATGDDLLREVAARLVSLSSGFAHVYRSSGDEFTLVMADRGDPLQLTTFVENILKKLSERFDVAGHQLFLGASAGLAIASGDTANIDQLVSDADLALNEAKVAGGRTCKLFMPTMRANAQARRELDIELRRAWAEYEFVLYFQPQLRVSDGALVGAEALLRWQHPTRGVLSPAAFIEALAASPVALEVGRWILRTACQTAASWRAKGVSLRIGVNLFPSHFSHGTLLQDVEAALAESGLPPEALELEITENIALSHDGAMLAPLQALRSRGVGVAFDDFGTGYASLSYLARFPLTRIKIDRSFVTKISETSLHEDRALLKSIIGMAHNLRLEVIAEGVETAIQAGFLRAENCEEAQGFLYAKPLPADEFEKYVRSAPSAFDHPGPRLVQHITYLCAK